MNKIDSALREEFEDEFAYIQDSDRILDWIQENFIEKKEVEKKLEQYFKHLLIAPNPQATKRELIKFLLQPNKE